MVGEADHYRHPTSITWHAAACAFSPVQGMVEQVEQANPTEALPPLQGMRRLSRSMKEK
jgi:hypothetical protein